MKAIPNMADKKLSPIEELEKKHLEASLSMQHEIDGLSKDLQDTEAMVRETRQKIMMLRRRKLNASYAYDSARAELLAAEKTKAA